MKTWKSLAFWEMWKSLCCLCVSGVNDQYHNIFIWTNMIFCGLWDSINSRTGTNNNIIVFNMNPSCFFKFYIENSSKFRSHLRVSFNQCPTRGFPNFCLSSLSSLFGYLLYPVNFRFYFSSPCYKHRNRAEISRKP